MKTREHTQGFTLIDLLVGVTQVGILAAIALPTFLSQADTAVETEAALKVGSLNRAQQAYYLENRRFGSWMELGLTTLSSQNYTYTSSAATGEAISLAYPVAGRALRGYAGRVWINPDANSSSPTISLVCAGAPNTVPAMPGLTACPRTTSLYPNQ